MSERREESPRAGHGAPPAPSVDREPLPSSLSRNGRTEKYMLAHIARIGEIRTKFWEDSTAPMPSGDGQAQKRTIRGRDVHRM